MKFKQFMNSSKREIIFEAMIQEGVVETLRDIVKSKYDAVVTFSDGAAKVGVEVAKDILAFYNTFSANDKKTVENLLNSKTGFVSLVDYVMNS